MKISGSIFFGKKTKRERNFGGLHIFISFIYRNRSFAAYSGLSIVSKNDRHDESRKTERKKDQNSSFVQPSQSVGLQE